MVEANDADEFIALTSALKSHLQRRQRAGIGLVANGSSVQANPVRRAQAANWLGGTVDHWSADTGASMQATTLEELRSAIGDCQRCKLCSGRTHIVFGVGTPRARLMFVGEGPGRDEDLQGEPFVGRAGQLLTDIITKGIGIKREDVYICNVVKCRPPENRNPEPDEVAACEPFLKKQIDLVRPEII